MSAPSCWQTFLGSCYSYLKDLKVRQAPFIYLGVSIFHGESRKVHLHALADRAISKISGWTGKILFMVGRVQLVQYVFNQFCSRTSAFIGGLFLCSGVC